jgi:hypothetical protein
MFSDLSIRLSNEILEQMDAAIERIHPALTDPQEFVEMAVEYALSNLREESEDLRLSLND